MKFDWQRERSPHWYGGDAFRSHLFNALSACFPEGERFIVDSVRAVRTEIQDAVLQKEVEGLLAQEGTHRYQHEQLNRHLRELGFGRSVERVRRILHRHFVRARVALSPHTQLAVTCAIEHLTATWSALELAREEFSRATESHARLFRWHMLEELEHACVALDVYRRVGGSELRRIAVYAGVLPLFCFHVGQFTCWFLREGRPVGRLKTWRSCLSYLLVRPGAIRSLPRLLSFFRPGFDAKNEADGILIERWRAVYAGSSRA